MLDKGGTSRVNGEQLTMKEPLKFFKRFLSALKVRAINNTVRGVHKDCMVISLPINSIVQNHYGGTIKCGHPE